MIQTNKHRAIAIKALIGGVVLVLILKVIQIQIWDSTYKKKAEATTIDPNIIYPSRGLIHDRNDKLLVYNDPVYDIILTYKNLDTKMDTTKFCQLLGLTKTEFIKNIEKDWSSNLYSKNVPFVFLKKISAKVYATFQEHLHEFPGFSVRQRNVRSYPYKNAAHVLGYLNEVSAKQLQDQNSKYERGDYLGATGIERTYEDLLKGEKGVQYILKDNIGRSVGAYEDGQLDKDPQSGEDLQLTIDIELQKFGEELMANRRGSIVAIEPKTGEILALVSSPTYDPNDLSINKNRGKTYQALSQDSLQPFFNRALSAKYPPGSIFKPILALIALQEELITSQRMITCTGAYHYKIYNWGCHAGPGNRNVTKAIQQSCNTFFYTAYRELIDQYGFNKPEFGLQKLSNYLEEFGLGKNLGIDLPGENSGLNPSSEFYNRLYASENGHWRSTYIISNGIGQGEIELTTLQMANLSATIANRGYFIQPHILKDSNAVGSSEKHLRTDVSIDKEHFEPVIDGMQLAISNGTAPLAYIQGINVCGKTGTSQNSQGEDHSVFFAFAPRVNPEIAIAVYIEHGGAGGSVAAPISSLMIEQYLKNNIDPSRQWIVNRMLK